MTIYTNIILMPAVFLITMIISLFSEAAKENLETRRFPAEFEPVEAIWLAWEMGHPIEAQYEMIKSLTPHTKVKILVSGFISEYQFKKELKSRGVPLDNIELHSIFFTEIWLRDSGPIFVLDNGKKKIVDFNFNGYGYPLSGIEKLITRVQERVDVKIAADLGLEVIESSIVSEGGNREFNGLGTLIVNETVELDRNPKMTKKQLEAEFARVLGVTNILWIKGWLVEDQRPISGAVVGPDGVSTAFTTYATGGHVDEMVRFVDENTLILPEVSEVEALQHPINARNREVLERNHEILRNARDQDGNPFTIIRVPASEPKYTRISPDHEYYDFLASLDFEDGSKLPETDVDILAASSYMNYVIANGVVIIPKFFEMGDSHSIHEKDEGFKDVMKSIYPNKEIVQINPLELNLFSGGGGGGMHCITQQEPLVE